MTQTLGPLGATETQELLGSKADLMLEAARRSIERLTVVEAYEAALEGGCVIDIRSDAPRDRDGIVPGSLHVPRTVLEWRLDPSSTWRNPHLDGSTPPILLCDHGWSSSLAAESLRHVGHAGACDVIGGFQEWQAQGLPVINAPQGHPPGQLPGMGGRQGDLAALCRQREQWERALTATADRYGIDPSAPARVAGALFREAGAEKVLELGSGQGRDALQFARSGLHVTAADFAPVAGATTRAKARATGLGERLRTVELDVRGSFPFETASFDACFAHMLFCMALTERELTALCDEVRRVLRPGGLCVYTARTVDDADFGKGQHLGENLYCVDGFVVHFFDPPLIERLAEGFELVDVEPFEEGALPRRLVRVTLKRPSADGSTTPLTSASNSGGITR